MRAGTCGTSATAYRSATFLALHGTSASSTSSEDLLPSVDVSDAITEEKSERARLEVLLVCLMRKEFKRLRPKVGPVTEEVRLAQRAVSSRTAAVWRGRSCTAH